MIFPSAEFEAAVAAVCHGTADEAQMRALNELLRGNPAAADAYLLRLDLHARLFQVVMPAATAKVIPLPVQSRRPAAVWLAAAAACVVLAVGAALWLGGNRHGGTTLEADLVVADDEVKEVRMEREGKPVTVSKMTPLRSGDIVRTGPDSSARIAYRREATWVELASETVVELSQTSDGKRITLREGRFEAQVAPQPKGRPMTCQTSVGRATVLGTHFCLTATSNRTTLEVQRGTVRLDHPAGGPATDVRAGNRAAQQDGDIHVRALGEQGKYEAESLILAEVRRGVTAMRREQGKASGDYLRDFHPERVGGAVTFVVPVPVAGRYRVIVGAAKHSNRGIYQLAIGANLAGPFADQGSPQDYFSSEPYTYEEFDLGTVSFDSPGEKLFQFTCLGKNDRAHWNMKLGVDYLKLIATP